LFVSKERVTKSYSNEEKYPIISYVFQLIGLWSINIGSWDLAAEKSPIEIIKITNQKPIKKKPIFDNKLSQIISKRIVN
jgi:hypothetical protein